MSIIVGNAGERFHMSLTNEEHLPSIGEEISVVECTRDQLDDLFALPVVILPPASVNVANGFGVQSGLQALITDDPVFNAAYAISLMEAVHRAGFTEKVEIFIRANALRFCENLNPAQRAEFLIRTAKLMQTDEMPALRERATKALANSMANPPCPASALITLAKLFADTGDRANAQLWLKTANASSEQCTDTAGIFFLNGLFREGIDLLDAFNLLKMPMGEWKQLDYITLLGYGLKNRELIRNPHYQEMLLTPMEVGKKSNTVLKALCYVGMIDEALTLARKLVAKTECIFPLLLVAKAIKAYHTDDTRGLHALREAAPKMPDPSRSFLEIINSNSFSVAENLETLQHLDHKAGKLEALWTLAFGIILKHSKSGDDHLDLGAIFMTIRNELMDSDAKQAWSHPPYWVKILRYCIEYGFLNEGLKTAEMFEQWYRSLGENGKENNQAIWCLSEFGILKLALGQVDSGRSDLEKAYKLQKEEESKYQVANNYAYFIVDVTKRLATRCPKMNIFRELSPELIENICTESFKIDSYLTIASIVEKWIAENVPQPGSDLESCLISIASA